MKPILQALLLADYVYEDKRTGKRIIAGVFNKVLRILHKQEKREEQKEGEPVTTPIVAVQKAGSPYAYFNVTEIHGETALQLRFVSLASHEVIFRTSPIKVEADTPLTAVERFLPVPPINNFPAGTYALELVYENMALGSYRVIIEEVPSTEVKT